MLQNKNNFIKDIASALSHGRCDLFVGSGASSPSGVVSWYGLLKPLADSIGLKINKDDDLPLIAQYILNENSGNRNIFRIALYREFASEFTINEIHKAIRAIHPSTIWTTNYDCLLENTFADVKYRVIVSDADLLRPWRIADVEIIKLHGSITDEIDECILTSHDYDQIFAQKPGIANKLKEALLQRSVLFIGYSYNDPDIKRILVETTQILKGKSQEHFMIIKKPQDIPGQPEGIKQELLRFELWVKEMQRLGIRCLIIDEYYELPQILNEIAEKAMERSVFVTGAHIAKANEFTSSLGTQLASLNEVVLIYGQSEGVSISVLQSFFAALVSQHKDLLPRVRWYPNPYALNVKYSDDSSLLPMLKKERSALFSHTRVVLLFPGGMGTNAEIEVALEHECLVLPVIQDILDYDNICIKRIVCDEIFMNLICEKAPEYYQLLLQKKPTTVEDIIMSLKKVLL